MHYNWQLKNGYPEKSNLKAFGTFVCGGGSTMGYKLAGFDHLGGVEIDEKIAKVYKKNHDPKHFYQMDIREFNEMENLPDELFDLDLLDGSPPCSSFSMAGSREKAWGKNKKFREGQTKQVLDDLVFQYCDTIIKLKPKCFILENVKGLITGNAKVYCKEIVKKLNQAGYKSQIFLLNAASMGVPQKRERVFIIGRQKELDWPDLKLEFNERPIKFKEVKNETNTKENLSEWQLNPWKLRTKKDKSIGDIIKRTENRVSGFTHTIIHDDDVVSTIIARNAKILYSIPRELDKIEICKIGSYPTDYDFESVQPQYLIGMSVPPLMTAKIAKEIRGQWFE